MVQSVEDAGGCTRRCQDRDGCTSQQRGQVQTGRIIYTWFDSERILGKYLLFFYIDQVAHCFSSRPPNRDLRLLEHELGRNSNFIVHED